MPVNQGSTRNRSYLFFTRHPCRQIYDNCRVRRIRLDGLNKRVIENRRPPRLRVSIISLLDRWRKNLNNRLNRYLVHDKNDYITIAIAVYRSHWPRSGVSIHRLKTSMIERPLIPEALTHFNWSVMRESE